MATATGSASEMSIGDAVVAVAIAPVVAVAVAPVVATGAILKLVVVSVAGKRSLVTLLQLLLREGCNVKGK